MDAPFADDDSALPPGQRLQPRLRPIQYGRVPRVNLESFALTVGGETQDGGLTRLTWADLQGLPQVEVVADHHCVSRRSVRGLRWGGVPAQAVLDLAPPAGSVRHVLAYAAYGYHANVTVDDLRHPECVLATHLGGVPLTPEHGWPLRLVLPHLYGWKGPKWLLSLEYSSAPRRGFWEQQGYHFTGNVWREERYAHQE